MEDNKLETLTITDVVQMPQFRENLKAVILELRKKYSELEFSYGPLKKTPLDAYIDRKITNEQCAQLYLKVLDKELDSSEWPSNLRGFIKALGDAAFYRTMKELTK